MGKLEGTGSAASRTRHAARYDHGAVLAEAAVAEGHERGDRLAAVHFMEERGIPHELAAIALYGLRGARAVSPVVRADPHWSDPAWANSGSRGRGGEAE